MLPPSWPSSARWNCSGRMGGELPEIIANVSELFSVEERKPTRSGVLFLNWDIQPNDCACAIKGAGLYGLFFDDWLIYVGMYRGKGGNPNCGQVARDRWWAHIGSITMRGYRVSVPKRTRKMIDDGQLARDLASGLSQGNELLCKDNGCCTSVNRMKFASSHWQEFKDADGSLLKRFKFLFVPAHFDDKKYSVTDFRAKLHCHEKQLIRNWSPTCNSGVENASCITIEETSQQMRCHIAIL